MSKKSVPLPDFESPPLIEVIIGLSFKQLSGLTTTHYGIFWQRIKDDYPLFEDHTPIIELPAGPGKIWIEAMDNAPLRRVFFIRADKDYLLQLQPNRLIHNWRKINDSSPYPHFPAAKEKFHAAWTEFQRFVSDVGIGPVQPVQFEITYINHFIEEPGSFPERTEFYTPLINWHKARSIKFLPTPTTLSYNIEFPLPEEQGTLNVSSRHGTRTTDNKDVMILELRVRGPIKGNENSFDERFELGHEWIVRGFKDLTSPEAHKQWKITR